jgi:hypothetical protein
MASDPRILQYIRQQMDAGFRRQQIYDTLLEAGWYREEVEQAFFEIANQKYRSIEPAIPEGKVREAAEKTKPDFPEKPGFFWKLRNALFHPGRFFDVVKEEGGISKALLFFVLVSLVGFAVALAVMLFAPSMLQPLLQDPILQQLYLYASMIGIMEIAALAVGYVAVIALAFLGAAIIHFIVYALRGSRGFHQTFKALMYASAPMIFLVLVFPLYLLSADYPFMDMAATGFVIALDFWGLLIAVKGLSRLHEISALKALVAIIAIPIIIVFIGLLFSLGTFNPAAYTSRLATGFGQMGSPSGWQYKYDGSFSIILRNRLAVPVTINSVTANCGAGGTEVVLETLDPMSVESGSLITYSSGDERCALREPGESYSVSVGVRYLRDGSMLFTESGTVTGTIEY